MNQGCFRSMSAGVPTLSGNMDPVEEQRTNNAVADSLKYELWNAMICREMEQKRQEDIEKLMEKNKDDIEEQILRSVLLEEKVESSTSKKRKITISSHIGTIIKRKTKLTSHKKQKK